MDDSNLPLYSIVIPTFERPERLSACLTALVALDFPKERFEVVVVDDGSRRSPEQSVKGFADRLAITFVRQDNRGPAAARNAGAKVAKGRILLFTDDDCRPEAAWLIAIDACFARNEGAMVGGAVLNGLPKDLFATASQRLVSYLYKRYEEGHPSRFFCSNNMALPADRFWEVEGFDESFPRPAGEDRDLCDRWRFAGFPMIYEPDAIVRHFHAMDLGEFWRQHFRYGESVAELNEQRTRRGQEPLQAEDRGFYLNMLRSPFGVREVARPFGVAVSIGLSQLASAAGYARARWQQRQRPER